MKSLKTCLVLALVSVLSSCGTSSDGGPDPSSDTVPDAVVAVDVPGAGPDLASDGIPDLLDEDIAPRVDPGIRLREAGWLRGDLHLHTIFKGGDDPVETVLSVAEYLEDPEFLAAHPEYEGNGLDFLAITDHRAASVVDDPTFVSDRLVLLSGEEFGGPSHAGLWGISETVDHDPDGDGATLEDYLAGVEAVHAQGGLFSPNHPFLNHIPFAWDVRTHDAIELINAGWALGSADFTPEDLADWEAEHGPASPLFEKAVAHTGGGGSMQTLVYYEAQLARGVHVALVGGSDRHVLFPVGFPTTWVLAETADAEGVIEGIRARRTLVSRNPAAATVELTITTPDGEFGVGSRVAAAGEVSVTARAGRADGGLLRIVMGHAVATDEALEDATLEALILEAEISGPDFTYETTIDVQPGDWIYAMVLEPLVQPGLSSELAERVPELAGLAAAAGVEDYDALVNIFWDYMDFSMLLSPEDCDPSLWDPTMLQCMAGDDHGIATYFIPDWLDRALQAWTVDDELTGWCFGAVTSAIVVE